MSSLDVLYIYILANINAKVNRENTHRQDFHKIRKPCLSHLHDWGLPPNPDYEKNKKGGHAPKERGQVGPPLRII